MPGAGLRPGHQQRLQLSQPLPRQCAELLLRRRPIAGPRRGIPQQQLRRLVVRQLPCQLHRLLAATQRAGDEGMLGQVGTARIRGQGPQIFRGGLIGITLAHGELAHQEGTIDPVTRPIGERGRRIRRGIGGGTGGEQRHRQQHRAGTAKNEHAASLSARHAPCHAVDMTILSCRGQGHWAKRSKPAAAPLHPGQGTLSPEGVRGEALIFLASPRCSGGAAGCRGAVVLVSAVAQ